MILSHTYAKNVRLGVRFANAPWLVEPKFECCPFFLILPLILKYYEARGDEINFQFLCNLTTCG